MRLAGLFIICYFTLLSALAQTENSWFELSTINNDPDYPFKPEKKIEGLCFITPSVKFNHYKQPIIITDRGVEILRIEFSESKGITTVFHGNVYHSADTLNKFKPWLFNNNVNSFALAFECTDTAGAFYKVRLNHTDVAFISKRNPNFQKLGFEDFVRRWTKDGFDFDRSENPLRSSPGATASAIAHPDEKQYKIWPARTLEVRDDWMKVKTIKGEEGWIRWKDGDEVKIRMYFQF